MAGSHVKTQTDHYTDLGAERQAVI